MSLNALTESTTSPLLSLLANGGVPKGFLGLTLTASAVLIPMTQVKTMYGVTIGYGAAVATMGLAVRAALVSDGRMVANLLSAATVCYGARLGIFLWF